MPDAGFPPYGLKMSKRASEDRENIPVDLQATLNEILDQLQANPKQHPDRLSPVSRDEAGKNFIYMHSDHQIQVTFEISEKENDKNIYVFNVAAPQFTTKKSIFMSYSHKDEEWLVLVKKFLIVLEQQGVIEFWDDTRIEPAADWKAEIQMALDSSKGALLLVSQDFLNSDFIGKYELPQLLAKAESEGKKIYWIPVSSSTVFESHREITRFQSLLKDPSKSLEDLSESERNQALVQVSKKLSALH